MQKSMKRQDSVREPVQGRSQQRVELILDACKSLILEHGCAGLKMGDIAATAGVSIASIYQYYPNKQAIVAALATHYLDVFREHVFNALEESPDNLDSLWDKVVQLTDDYYRLHLLDPVVRDVLIGSATDKTLRDITNQDSEQHLEFFFERTKHLFKPSQHENVRQTFLLTIDFTRMAVHRAVELDQEAGIHQMDIAKKMLSSIWDGAIKPMARVAKKR